MYYIEGIIDKTQCVGNTLSTLNVNLTALDLAAYEISSTFDTIVSELSTAIYDTNLSIVEVSSNAPSFYQTTAYQISTGEVYVNFADGSNTFIPLTTNGYVDNISNLSMGDFGKLIIQISPTTSIGVTGWGSSWIFQQNNSAMNINLSAINIVDYYCVPPRILATIESFDWLP